MKRVLFVIFALSLAAMAQAATRPVVLNWTASTSSSVTGYAIYSGTVATGGTSCAPSLTGTPISTVTGTTFTVQEPTQAAYCFSVVAQAPACTSTTSITTPCGSAAAATVSFVPVPPQTAGATTVVVVVP